jgi:hypothetical protein
MTISVTENSDGTFTIDWDQNDPQEKVLNDWTEEDFIECLRSHCEEALRQSDDPDNEQVKIEDAIKSAVEKEQEINRTQGFVRKDEEDPRLPRLFF